MGLSGGDELRHLKGEKKEGDQSYATSVCQILRRQVRASNLLHSAMDAGMIQCQAGPCVFKKEGWGTCASYFTCTCRRYSDRRKLRKSAERVCDILNKTLPTNNLRKVERYMGGVCHREGLGKSALTINQTTLVNTVLKRFHAADISDIPA